MKNKEAQKEVQFKTPDWHGVFNAVSCSIRIFPPAGSTIVIQSEGFFKTRFERLNGNDKFDVVPPPKLK